MNYSDDELPECSSDVDAFPAGYQVTTKNEDCFFPTFMAGWHLVLAHDPLPSKVSLTEPYRLGLLPQNPCIAAIEGDCYVESYGPLRRPSPPYSSS